MLLLLTHVVYDCPINAAEWPHTKGAKRRKRVRVCVSKGSDDCWRIFVGGLRKLKNPLVRLRICKENCGVSWKNFI